MGQLRVKVRGKSKAFPSVPLIIPFTAVESEYSMIESLL
jgi:hypothetical protein